MSKAIVVNCAEDKVNEITCNIILDLLGKFGKLTIEQRDGNVSINVGDDPTPSETHKTTIRLLNPGSHEVEAKEPHMRGPNLVVSAALTTRSRLGWVKPIKFNRLVTKNPELIRVGNAGNGNSRAIVYSHKEPLYNNEYFLATFNEPVTTTLLICEDVIDLWLDE